MYNGKKVVVVLPAYNAALTMEKTIAEIPMDIVDELGFVDDNSTDNSIEVAQHLGIKHIVQAYKKQRIWRQSKKLLRQGA